MQWSTTKIWILIKNPDVFALANRTHARQKGVGRKRKEMKIMYENVNNLLAFFVGLAMSALMIL
jgi:hypothetical protein